MGKFHVTAIVAIVLMVTVGLLTSNVVVAKPVPGDKGYDKGYRLGESDARKGCSSNRCNWDILKDNGFEDHSGDFRQGYIDGFCTIKPNGGSDDPRAKFDCILDKSKS